jgi:hypothetical protein
MSVKNVQATNGYCPKNANNLAWSDYSISSLLGDHVLNWYLSEIKRSKAIHMLIL